MKSLTFGDNEQGLKSISASTFAQLLCKKALVGIKSINIKPTTSGYESKILLKVAGDTRWHWISDTVSSSSELYQALDMAIGIHINFNSDDSDSMEEWNSALIRWINTPQTPINLYHSG